MKFVLFYMFLFGLLFAGPSISENNTEQDKDHPSWSSGLPGRGQTVNKLDKPKLTHKDIVSEEEAIEKPSLQVEIDSNDFELKLQTPDLSEIEVEKKKPGFFDRFKGDKEKDEPQPEEKPLSGRKKRALLQSRLRAEEKSKRQQLNKDSPEDLKYARLIEQNSKKYHWKITKQAKLEYPRSAARKGLQGWVDVRVTINQQGKVVSAHAEKYSEQGKVFVDPALKSLRKYRFEPPRKQDISTNVSRIYRIEFKL